MNETTPDLTKTLDPVELWPNLEDTPDWPLFRDDFSRRMNPHFSRQDAENRLDSLSRQLHGNSALHDPSDAERKAAHTQLFTETITPGNAKSWKFEALGLTFRPANHTVEARAHAVVEAVHIRGHLRKLDAEAAAESKRKKEADEARLRNIAESWPAREAELVAEVDALSEGEARHVQRIEDERAYRRAADLRRMLKDCRLEAKQAANALGIAEPTAAAPAEVEALTI